MHSFAFLYHAADWEGDLGDSFRRVVHAHFFSVNGRLPSDTVTLETTTRMVDLAWDQHCEHKLHRPSDVNLNPRVQRLTTDYTTVARVWSKGSLDGCLNILAKPYLYGIVGFAYLGYHEDNHNCTQVVHSIFFARVHKEEAKLKDDTTKT